MAPRDQPGDGWAVDFGRQPARIVEGQPEGPCTDAFEIICCGCDHPSTITVRPHPGFSGSAGHDPIADGVAAGKKHPGRQLAGAACRGR
jgi:hypothetical protein